MAELKETVTTTQDEGITEQGAQVQQKTRQISTQAATDTKTTATNIIWYIVGLIEVLLAVRFALKLFGANPSSGFVDFIYSVTNVLTAPFDSIFGVVRTQAGDVSSVFEPSILVAAAVYALVGWGIVKLITLNRNN
jgi:hypothetical protein